MLYDSPSARVRRVDLASGPVVVYARGRGVAVETLSRVTSLRDPAELNDLINALMEVREQLIEEPPVTEGGHA